MPEVVVGSFVARPGKEADELFGENASIVVYYPLPGGEPTKGSLAEHAAG